MRRSLLEAAALLFLLAIFFSLLIPNLLYARREARDGIRRDEISAFKRELEQYFNAHNTYPAEYNAAPHQYVMTVPEPSGAAGWYLRAWLENYHPDETGFDAEEGRNYYYRYFNQGPATFYDVCGGAAACTTFPS